MMRISVILQWTTGGVIAAILASAVAARAATPATQPRAIDEQIGRLSAEDFGSRKDAVKKLQALIADQIAQQAKIEEMIETLQSDLLSETRQLAMVRDEEARQQTQGLLQMEAGLANWVVIAMGAPKDQRDALLTWGLSPTAGPILGRAFGTNLRDRIAAAKDLAAITDSQGADWTLAKLVNCDSPGVRMASMAALLQHKPSAVLVDALWFRGITQRIQGEESSDESTTDPDITVEFPGRDSLTISADDSSDQDNAVDVLITWHSDLVTGKLQDLIAQRTKREQDLSDAAEHRLMEAYKVKEAIPLLAKEALGDMGTESSGKAGQTIATNRTSAIGAIAVILGQEPDAWDLDHTDGDEPLAWCTPGEDDGNAVMKFYDWWSVHHAEYGVKRKPKKPELNRDAPPPPVMPVPDVAPVPGNGAQISPPMMPKGEALPHVEADVEGPTTRP